MGVGETEVLKGGKETTQQLFQLLLVLYISMQRK